MKKTAFWIYHPRYCRDYGNTLRPTRNELRGRDGFCTHWIEPDRRRAMAVARRLPKKGLVVELCQGRRIVKTIIDNSVPRVVSPFWWR